MPVWTDGMQQTFEYYTVDPNTWGTVEKLDYVKSCTITRSNDDETLGSASFEIDNSIANDTYVRPFLVTVQNKVREIFPLGTYLIQTSGSTNNGKIESYSIDAYTPLLELKEKNPSLGYSILKSTTDSSGNTVETNIMEQAYYLMSENMRGPIVKTDSSETLYSDFVANTNDTWLSFCTDLIANANYTLGLDELCRVIFMPKQNVSSMQPVWTYTDDNCSILYSDITKICDLYGIPNYVEVVYSTDTEYYVTSAINDDENSPTSTVSRGRRIDYRDTSPALSGNSTHEQLDQYAKDLLEAKSTVNYTIEYKHGYNGVRIGDCVRFNVKSANIVDIKAKVTSQTINCTPGCPVSETAVCSVKYWG